MIEEILAETNTRMEKAIEALVKELATIRTGRASPVLLDSVKVDYYGVPTPLNQIASVAAPEAQLLIIQPWDRTVLSNIEKAILKSDLGLNPSNDGTIIRLAIPPLTEERRRELVKMVKKKIEERKVILRNIRHDTVGKLKSTEKNSEISQDEYHRALAQLQKIIDAFMEQVNQIDGTKEAEIMEI